MSDVGSWDPSAALSERHRTILDAAATALDEEGLGLDSDDMQALRDVMQVSAESWSQFVEEVADERVIVWIRVLTLAETRLSGFEAGAKSPVIALVRVLKQRGSYPDELTAWIKSNTDNRFLPYGSLLDRLSR